MTSSSETGHLVLFSSNPGTRLTVLDSRLAPAGTGVDRLDLTLPPGVYQIESEQGGAGATDLISLAPGADVNRELTVQFPATAPVVGTSTANESHGDLAAELSGRVADATGHDAGLVLLLRNLRGFGQEPLPTDRVQLYDERLQPVTGWTSGWAPDASGGSLGQCGRFPSGPYLLRTERVTGPGETESTDQTVWLSPGFQTLVFLPNGNGGPDARAASVHMVPLTGKWDQWDPRAHALEEALAGLRDLDATDRDGELKVDPTFPMLALVRLVRQLLTGIPVFRGVTFPAVSRLREVLGNHPDVLALTAVLGDEVIPVPWPPIFALVYERCLLRVSRYEASVLPVASPAERAALYRRPSSPWLQWESTSDVLTSTPSREVLLAPAPGAFSPELAETRAPTVAVTRVEGLLREIAGFEGSEPREIVERLGSAELAARCGLPMRLVDAALRELGTQARVGAI